MNFTLQKREQELGEVTKQPKIAWPVGSNPPSSDPQDLIFNCYIPPPLGKASGLSINMGSHSQCRQALGSKMNFRLHPLRERESAYISGPESDTQPQLLQLRRVGGSES